MASVRFVGAGRRYPGDGPSLADITSQALVRLEGRPQLQKGERVRLVIDPTAVHVFDTSSGERLTA